MFFFQNRDSSIFLAEQLIALNVVERKKWLANITANIQSQGLETPNVERKHIELAIKVILNLFLFPVIDDNLK
jgi:hypothetical protein